MYITYWGTAAAEGVPAIFCECEFCRYARDAGGKEVRTRSGSLIDGRLKLDFGPDSYMQSLKFNQSLAPVEHILITHSHHDHFCPEDIDYIRKPFGHRDAKLHVYGNAKVEAGIAPFLNERHLDFTRVEPFKTYQIDEYAVTPLQAVHCVGTDEEPLFYLIEKDGKSLLYGLDTDLFTEADWEFLKGRRMDLVTLDCTNGILDPRWLGHMGIRKNLDTRRRMLEEGIADEKTVFVANHFSHNGLIPYEGLQKLLPGFTVAYDGLTMLV